MNKKALAIESEFQKRFGLSKRKIKLLRDCPYWETFLLSESDEEFQSKVDQDDWRQSMEKIIADELKGRK